MWDAAHQLHRLSYKNVAFLGDCLKLIKHLDCANGDKQNKNDRIPQATSTIHDIEVVAGKDHFIFYYVPRSFVNVVDRLAKNARINIQDYVFPGHPTKSLYVHFKSTKKKADKKNSGLVKNRSPD